MDNTSFLPPTSSTQVASATLLFGAAKKTDDDLGSNVDDESDSEIEFKRPEKAVRKIQVFNRFK
jgi:hypothetical protein